MKMNEKNEKINDSTELLKHSSSYLSKELIAVKANELEDENKLMKKKLKTVERAKLERLKLFENYLNQEREKI